MTAGRRQVILAPAVAKLLRELWLASPYESPEDIVFCNANGRGLNYREVGSGFRRAVSSAGSPAKDGG